MGDRFDLIFPPDRIANIISDCSDAGSVVLAPIMVLKRDSLPLGDLVSFKVSP